MSKKHGEDWLNLYNHPYGEDILIFRLSNIYGTGDKDRIIPSIIRKARKGENIVIFGEEHYVNYLHVDDLVRAFFSAATKERIHNRILNIGAEESINLKEVACIIVSDLKSPSRIRTAPLPEYEYPYYSPDTVLAEKEIGFKAMKNLKHGLQELVQLGAYM